MVFRTLGAPAIQSAAAHAGKPPANVHAFSEGSNEVYLNPLHVGVQVEAQGEGLMVADGAALDVHSGAAGAGVALGRSSGLCRRRRMVGGRRPADL